MNKHDRGAASKTNKPDSSPVLRSHFLFNGYDWHLFWSFNNHDFPFNFPMNVYITPRELSVAVPIRYRVPITASCRKWLNAAGGTSVSGSAGPSQSRRGEPWLAECSPSR